jgi:hypothetical protein
VSSAIGRRACRRARAMNAPIRDMITTPTVFVLGAGASVDFEFPIGQELLRLVVDQFSRGAPGWTQMIEFGWAERDIERFCNALWYSAEPSIDAFLEKRPDFMDIGKVCMAIELIRREQTQKIFRNPDKKPNWLKYLFRRMQGDGLGDFATNRVSFVTFNYDRVLEHFLYTALVNSWGESEDAVVSALSRIPMIRLHGRLGYLPWQPNHRGRVRQFEPTIDAQSVRIAASEIKVVHEGVEERKEQFDEAKKLIARAERVYLLGVGTHNVNLERLGASKFVPNKVSATEIGLTDAEYTEIRNQYGDMLYFRRNTDCSQMISNFVQWT